MPTNCDIAFASAFGGALLTLALGAIAILLVVSLRSNLPALLGQILGSLLETGVLSSGGPEEALQCECAAAPRGRVSRSCLPVGVRS